jgi:multicomponent K+:H+ antiporter subunit D
VLLTIFSGQVMEYAEATAADLYDPAPYIDAVMKRVPQ